MIYQFSTVGNYHRKEGVDNQDAFAVAENGQYSAAALADGVSTCPRSREGAQAACDTAVSLLYGKPEFFLSGSREATARVMLDSIMSKLQSLASDGDPVPLSSTLAFVLLDKVARRALLFQLGDGLVAGNRNGRWVSLIQPDSSMDGTCVTTTAGASRRCRAVCIDAANWDSFMLMTDGAWRTFSRHGRVMPAVAEAYGRGEYAFLAHALQNNPAEDDRSFLIINAN